MLFSIIIPIYNVEQYLEECLNSVVSQTYRDFEVICVNDGSTDNSLSILQAFVNKDSRIVVINQQNKGVSEARNVGLKVAKGEYVLFVDSDDWIADNTLEILSQHLDGQDFIAFCGKLVEGPNRIETKGFSIVESGISGWDYLQKSILMHSSVAFVCVILRAYNREFLLNHNLFFEEGIYHEDTLFTPLVCYYAKKVTSITDVLYYYRVREGSIITTKNAGIIKKKRIDTISVANILSAFFADKMIERLSMNRYIAGLYFGPFMPGCETPDYEKELMAKIDWSLFKSVCTYPRNKWLFSLLKLSPSLFRVYLSAAGVVRKVVK